MSIVFIVILCLLRCSQDGASAGDSDDSFSSESLESTLAPEPSSNGQASTKDSKRINEDEYSDENEVTSIASKSKPQVEGSGSGSDSLEATTIKRQEIKHSDENTKKILPQPSTTSKSSEEENSDSLETTTNASEVKVITDVSSDSSDEDDEVETTTLATTSSTTRHLCLSFLDFLTKSCKANDVKPANPRTKLNLTSTVLSTSTSAPKLKIVTTESSESSDEDDEVETTTLATTAPTTYPQHKQIEPHVESKYPLTQILTSTNTISTSTTAPETTSFPSDMDYDDDQSKLTGQKGPSKGEHKMKINKPTQSIVNTETKISENMEESQKSDVKKLKRRKTTTPRIPSTDGEDMDSDEDYPEKLFVKTPKSSKTKPSTLTTTTTASRTQRSNIRVAMKKKFPPLKTRNLTSISSKKPKLRKTTTPKPVFRMPEFNFFNAQTNSLAPNVEPLYFPKSKITRKPSFKGTKGSISMSPIKKTAMLSNTEAANSSPEMIIETYKPLKPTTTFKPSVKKYTTSNTLKLESKTTNSLGTTTDSWPIAKKKNISGKGASTLTPLTTKISPKKKRVQQRLTKKPLMTTITPETILTSTSLPSAGLLARSFVRQPSKSFKKPAMKDTNEAATARLEKDSSTSIMEKPLSNQNPAAIGSNRRPKKLKSKKQVQPKTRTLPMTPVADYEIAEDENVQLITEKPLTNIVSNNASSNATGDLNLQNGLMRVHMEETRTKTEKKKQSQKKAKTVSEKIIKKKLPKDQSRTKTAKKTSTEYNVKTVSYSTVDQTVNEFSDNSQTVTRWFGNSKYKQPPNQSK